MNALPLIYGFRELVAGNGFLAGVTVDGRALVKMDDDGTWWVFGVEPGGIAERGDSAYEAYLRFKQSFREVLTDTAWFSPAFEVFREELAAMGRQVNETWAAEWDAARVALRSGELQPEGSLADLPRKTGDVHVGVTAVQLSQTTADDNPGDTTLSTAA